MTDDGEGPAHDGREHGGRDDEVRGARRIPGPRAAADDFDMDHVTPPPPVPQPESVPPQPEPDRSGTRPNPPPTLVLPHRVLKALLGAWALSACSTAETEAVEEHLTECAPCADEALRLRDAVGLLHTDGSLDLDPLLRTRVLDNCPSRHGPDPGARLGGTVRRGDRPPRRAAA